MNELFISGNRNVCLKEYIIEWHENKHRHLKIVLVGQLAILFLSSY